MIDLSSRKKINTFESKGLMLVRMEDSAESYGVSGWFRKRFSENSNLHEKLGNERKKRTGITSIGDRKKMKFSRIEHYLPYLQPHPSPFTRKVRGKSSYRHTKKCLIERKQRNCSWR